MLLAWLGTVTRFWNQGRDNETQEAKGSRAGLKREHRDSLSSMYHGDGPAVAGIPYID